MTVSGLQVRKSVEIFSIDQNQWATAADIPQPLYACSGEVVNDCVYLLGGLDKSYNETKVAFCCSLIDLITSCRSSAL